MHDSPRPNSFSRGLRACEYVFPLSSNLDRSVQNKCSDFVNPSRNPGLPCADDTKGAVWYNSLTIRYADMVVGFCVTSRETFWFSFYCRWRSLTLMSMYGVFFQDDLYLSTVTTSWRHFHLLVMLWNIVPRKQRLASNTISHCPSEDAEQMYRWWSLHEQEINVIRHLWWNLNHSHWGSWWIIIISPTMFSTLWASSGWVLF